MAGSVDNSGYFRDGSCMNVAQNLLSIMNYYYRTPDMGPRRRLRI